MTAAEDPSLPDPGDPAGDPGQSDIGWRRKLGAYVALTKPRIIELLLVTTVPTMVVAERGLPSVWLMVATVIGGTLAAGGANAINMYVDRDIDKVMDRTKKRPLATGVITPRSALVFAIGIEVAAFLLLWSKPAMADAPIDATPDEGLVRSKRCAQCHEQSPAINIPIKAAGDCRGPRFTLDDAARKDIAAYVAVATRDRHPSEFDARQRRLVRAGCFRCHSISDRLSPLEEAGSTLGGAYAQMIPFLKTPRLTNASTASG